MAREIPIKLRQRIIKFFITLPNIAHKNAQEALLYSAGLDNSLYSQIDLTGAPQQVFQQLVQTLLLYGTLEDKRYALEAVITAAKFLALVS